MLLLRGATGCPPARQMRMCFNTCSSCEEQLAGDDEFGVEGAVSIHAPLARSNVYPEEAETVGAVSIHAPLARSNWKFCKQRHPVQFQYMLLLRGATLPTKPRV